MNKAMARREIPPSAKNKNSIEKSIGQRMNMSNLKRKSLIGRKTGSVNI